MPMRGECAPWPLRMARGLYPWKENTMSRIIRLHTYRTVAPIIRNRRAKEERVAQWLRDGRERTRVEGVTPNWLAFLAGRVESAAVR